MTRALVITGGNCADDIVLPWYDFCIAADSGLDTAKRLGVFPQVIVGDFDSVSEPPSEYVDPVSGRKSEIITHPARKDDTDTNIAAMLAVERLAEEVYIVGGLGGRVDHTLSNIVLLKQLAEMKVNAVLTDGECELRMMEQGESLTVPFGEYKYFSVFASKAIVSLEGCAYPLDHGRIFVFDNYAVSNEPLECGATVTCHSGTLLLVRSERLR